MTMVEMFIRTPQDRAERQRRLVSLRQHHRTRLGAHWAYPVFPRYMELCLLPSRAWVTTRVTPQQFGKAGDFITSSDVLLSSDVCWRASSRKYGGPSLACGIEI